MQKFISEEQQKKNFVLIAESNGKEERPITELAKIKIRGVGK